MTEFKEIKKDSDISHARLQKHFDLVMYGKEYDVYEIDGYMHTMGGKYGKNCYYACPTGEEPSYDNLIEFNGIAPTWGVFFEPTNYVRRDEVMSSGKCWITRNGEKFYNIGGRTMEYALAKAQYKLVRLFEDHPLSFQYRDWKERAKGTTFYYKGNKYVITGFDSDNDIISYQVLDDGTLSGHMLKFDLLWEKIDWYGDDY